MPITIRRRDIASETGFRRAIVREIDVDGQEIAVRRVRSFAEGRLVRETWFRVGLVWYREHDRAASEALALRMPVFRVGLMPVFRVTRIRRA